MYKISNYIHSFKDKESDRYLFYNYLSTVLISVSKEQYELINKILSSPNAFINNNFFDILLHNGFVIENDNELSKLKKDYLQRINEGKIDISICPTLECNFSCSYCYQRREKARLTQTRAKQIIDYVNQINSEVCLNWIGGEPLLDYEIMEFIVNRLHVSYSSTIYTNGYLLDKYINKLGVLNVQMLYITIDGQPEVHNKVRTTKTDEHTFSKILANINQVVKIYPQIKIIIKTNIESGNGFDINAFLSYFSNLSGRIRMIPGCVIKDNVDFVDYSNLFYDTLLKTRFAIYKLPQRHIIGCPAYNPKSLAFDANGKIHRCLEGIGTNSMIIGKIDDNGIVNIKNKELMLLSSFNIFNKKRCVSCKLFPYCMGGCLKRQISNVEKGECSLYENLLKETESMISEYFNNFKK